MGMMDILKKKKLMRNNALRTSLALKGFIFETSHAEQFQFATLKKNSFSFKTAK